MLKPRQANTDVMKRLIALHNRLGNNISIPWDSECSPYNNARDGITEVTEHIHGNVNRNLREIKIHD